jgi:glycosyltransferase involved in cell wall biosynthesis
LFSNRSRKRGIRKIASQFAFAFLKSFPVAIQWGIAEAIVPTIAPPADINIATKFDTARITALLPGRKFYFVQHYEPYFGNEYPDPQYAEEVAFQSYKLGLQPIANSSWLRNKLISETGDKCVALCPNAIDQTVFSGTPKRSADPKRVVVISYGGRKAEWKGFRDMAAAVAIARSKAPKINIEWRVYGDSLLPPDNPVAHYIPLGFLSPSALSQAYRQADVLLSASWYESFPLFPIEAMACGVAVITTQFGTEDYARHAETAEVVEARRPDSIAAGLLKLIEDPEYRFRIATAGNQISKEFSWENSVKRLESIVMDGCHQSS